MENNEAFFLVWSPTGQTPPVVRHPTFESAKAEAERLALQAPSSTFFVLEAVGFARKVQVQWTDLVTPGDAFEPEF